MDIHYFLSWLHHKYLTYNDTHNANQWILTFEDDILLCPLVMKFVLQRIYEIKNNIAGFDRLNIIFLGGGATGILFRAEYIPRFYDLIRKYIETFEHKRVGYAWDQHIHHEATEDIAASDVNLVFHPSSKHTNSTVDHEWSGSYNCHRSEKGKFPYPGFQYIGWEPMSHR